MKLAIVTGVLGGIGKESALQLCHAGYAVVGMDVVDAGNLSAFENFDFTYVKGDLSSTASREELIKTAVKKGEISALVNVAGVAPKVRRDILEMTEESYDFVMGINTKGTLFLTQAVANEMVKQGKGGSIVNISSCSAYTSST
ncbi:MAG: SDR family NAD(P)-dependent oxidoreductase, partial [Clostridia bacterium]|nr:SDR family NAD(P)-dependent oxidoreductase [Clostridia bacterium]